MGMAHQQAKAILRGPGPHAGVRQAAFFDYAPGIVPPAAIVVSGLWFEHVGCGHRVRHIRMHGAEDKKLAVDGDRVIKDRLLNVRLSREDEDGTNREARL